MAEIENALRLQPSGRRPQQSGAALSGLSVLVDKIKQMIPP
jgi:hypothetical protein